MIIIYGNYYYTEFIIHCTYSTYIIIIIVYTPTEYSTHIQAESIHSVYIIYIHIK